MQYLSHIICYHQHSATWCYRFSVIYKVVLNSISKPALWKEMKNIPHSSIYLYLRIVYIIYLSTWQIHNRSHLLHLFGYRVFAINKSAHFVFYIDSAAITKNINGATKEAAECHIIVKILADSNDPINTIIKMSIS